MLDQDKVKCVIFNILAKYNNSRKFIILTYNYAEKLINNSIYQKYASLSYYISLFFLNLRLFILYNIVDFELSTFDYCLFGFHGIFRLYTIFSFVVHQILFPIVNKDSFKN